MGVLSLQSKQQDMGSISEETCADNAEDKKEKRSSTPSHHREILEQQNSNIEEVTANAAYNAWMVKHPSALNKFDQMMAMVTGKKVVVFLDYDGTLSPIVDDPDQAFMSDSMRATLDKVAQYFPTCIISGRRREKVFEFVKLTNVYYVGSHGMDIKAPITLPKDSTFISSEKRSNGKEKDIILFQPAKEFLPIIEQVFKQLEKKTNGVPGIMIENNRFCISVHFRRVKKENWNALEELVTNIANSYPSLHLTKGRKVIEIRPSIKWDKGCALEYLLNILGFGSSSDVVPLYIGDDRTDEDAFHVLQSRGQGYSIIVSSIPKNTKASYSLRDPTEVMYFLLHLYRWKENIAIDRSVL